MRTLSMYVTNDWTLPCTSKHVLEEVLLHEIDVNVRKDLLEVIQHLAFGFVRRLRRFVRIQRGELLDIVFETEMEGVTRDIL